MRNASTMCRTHRVPFHGPAASNADPFFGVANRIGLRESMATRRGLGSVSIGAIVHSA
jgi:hypothetical protein